MTTSQLSPDLIGKFLNRYGYSDINPVGKIVALVGKQSVKVELYAATEQITKLEFQVGGFSAHCVNQGAQQWNIESRNEFVTIRMSAVFLRSVRVEDEPVKYYDYNF